MANTSNEHKITDEELFKILKAKNNKYKELFPNRPIILKLIDDTKLPWWFKNDKICYLYYETKNRSGDSPIDPSAYFGLRRQCAEDEKFLLHLNKQEVETLSTLNKSKEELWGPITKLAAVHCLSVIKNPDLDKLDYTKGIDLNYLDKCMEAILKKTLVLSIEEEQNQSNSAVKDNR